VPITSLLLSGFLLAPQLPGDLQVAPELRANDRVAMVGTTFIEREADGGQIETALLLSHPEARLVFRNFGWSGDTIAGASRGYFEPEEGYGLLLEHVVAAEPTVILLAYGANAAWDGAEGVEDFRAGLSQLMDDLAERTKARFILLSPIRQEAFASPYPNPVEHNKELARYTAVIEGLAAARHVGFIDLFSAVRAPSGQHWTSNSIHLTPTGYQKAAEVLVQAFGKSVIQSADSGALRRAVIAKNDQFFHYWRPQNTTYLFGFRKHEQGQNAVELVAFASYVDRLDTQIQTAAMAISVGEKPVFTPVTNAGLGVSPKGHEYVGVPVTQRETFRVPEDLEVTLFAAEPMVANPTNMNWDARGRLWVASAPMYPHVKPGHRAIDRILILEDLDGDGKADKSTVFAEDLLIPTLVLPGDGGVYVANSTELLHLVDTDGDDKADEKRIVMSGFGTEDTHHILHTPRWGQDGLMYFNQAIYIHSHVETPWGVSRLMAGGIWQFEPRTGRMRVVSKGLTNSWGHDMDAFGQSFATDGAGGHGINYIFPGVAGVNSYGTRHVLKGMNPGQPKLCGLEILSGTHLPEAYRGLLATNDFRGHRTVSFQLSDNESGYASKRSVELIGAESRSYDPLGKDSAFRPVDIKMGPDGAIYVADWCNVIIQHGEVDFRDDRRDHENGRIWRISTKGKPPLKAPPIHGASIAQLIENLESTEPWVVGMSKRTLIERGHDVLAPVLEWQRGLQGERAEVLRLHALWLHVGLHRVERDVLRRCLTAEDARVRAAAIRVARHWLDQLPNAVEMLAAAVVDPHPRVRLEALHGLRDLNSARAAELAVLVLDRPMDKVLDYALVLTLRELEEQWAGATSFGGSVAHVAYAIKATGNTQPLGGLFAALQAGEIPAADRDDVLLLIAKHGDSQQVGSLFELANGDALPAATRASVYAAITDAVAARDVRPDGDLQPLVRVIESSQGDVLVAAARLAGRLRVAPSIGALHAVAASANHNAGLIAIEAIADIGGDAAVQVLQGLVRDHHSPEHRVGALANLVRVDRFAAGLMAVSMFKDLPETIDPGPVFDAFYREQEGPAALGEALGGKAVPRRIAQIGVQRAMTSGRDLGEHVSKLSRAGGLAPMKQRLNRAGMAEAVAQVAARGNPVIGERIYRRASLLCVSCHAIGGAGSSIGPDLVSLGASAPVDYIIQSLLDPNAKIKEGHHMTVVTMNDGRFFSGAQASDADGTLVLRGVTGKTHSLRSAQVKSKFISPVSMMPPGLTASLQPEEFSHLVAFMAQLGKPGRFSSRNAGFVRSFEVLISDGSEADAMDPEAVVENPARFQWRPAFALVNGAIPLDDTSVFDGGERVLRFAIEVTTAGLVSLRLKNGQHVRVWQGREELGFRRGNVRLNLSKGTHQLILHAGAENLSALISVELRDVKGSKAVAKLRSGGS
jgi:putative heme-binding domain-containing protein